MSTKLIEVCTVNNEHYYANEKIAESLKLCDALVLVEGHEEFSGNPKIPSFKQYTSDKITHVTLPICEGVGETFYDNVYKETGPVFWYRDRRQRAWFFTTDIYQQLKDDDILLISDFDEIINSDIISHENLINDVANKKNGGLTRFTLRTTQYYVNAAVDQDIHTTIAFTKRYYETYKQRQKLSDHYAINNLRFRINIPHDEDDFYQGDSQLYAGWHHSNLCTADQLLNKTRNILSPANKDSGHIGAASWDALQQRPDNEIRSKLVTLGDFLERDILDATWRPKLIDYKAEEGLAAFCNKKFYYSWPKISVTMLTYKRHEMFKQTLDSFLQHTSYPNLEFLVWVNNSDVEYEQLINSYGDLWAYKHFCTENEGIGGPRNILNEKAVGQFILNLEDDFICTATKADNYLEKAVKVLQTYTDVGQVVFRDIPMEGYDDAEIGELRDDCFVMKNIYPDHSPCYTNQAHLMPKRIWKELGPFTSKNQEDNFGKPFDKKYKCVKLGHERHHGFFHHIGLVSAASQEDSEKLGTYFCGNPRVEKQKYSKVAFIIIMPGEELFVEASILEAKDFFDKICIIEGKHTFFNKPKTEFVMDSSNWFYNKYSKHPKITFVKTDSRYFVDEFKSELHLSASNYNKNYAHFYIAAELAGIDSEWYFLLDSDELLTHKTLQRLELILKQNQPDEYYVAALPTQLFSRYINGKSSVPAYTPFVVYSHKSFHLLQGNRGFIIPPMTEWHLLSEFEDSPLLHWGWVRPDGVGYKHNNWSLIDNNHENVDPSVYLDETKIEIIDCKELPDGITQNLSRWEQAKLIAYPNNSVEDVILTEKPTIQFNLNFDDFCSAPGYNILKEMDTLFQTFPQLKISLYTSPRYWNIENMWDNKEFLDTTKKLVADGRIEILAHGLTHEEDYFTMSKTDFSHLLMQFEQECEQHQLKFEKVWKTPGWHMTDNLFAALEENNWAVDIHPDYSEQASKYKSLKTVSHNWNIEDSLNTSLKEIYAHGHCNNDCGNGLRECFQNIIDALTELEKTAQITYTFVSDKFKKEKAKTYFNTKGVPMQKLEELEKFRETIQNAAPTVAMEVGSESGGMLHEFAKLPSVKKIISVDLLNTLGGWSEMTEEFRSNLKEHLNAIRPDIELIFFNSGSQHPEIRSYLEHSQALDVIFIDGNHNFGGVDVDYNLKDFVRPGGLVMFHDVRKGPWSGDVPAFWEQVVVPQNDTVELLDTVDTEGEGIGYFIKQEDLPVLPNKSSVCLNMIVKNEADNLRKYHANLIPYIDEYLIVDTGSTDDTKAVIKDLFKGIPGKILDHPFDDYSSSRNVGLDSISSDWILMLDADHQLSGNLRYLQTLQTLDKNINSVTMEWREKKYSLRTKRLLRNNQTLLWKGRAHEMLTSDKVLQEYYTEEIFIYHYNTGSGKLNKYERELKLLKKDWAEQQNARTCFYIGCDYYWAENYEQALDWFITYESLPTKSGKWDEEIYKAKLYEGRCYQLLDNFSQSLICYDQAHNLDPDLIEPLVWKAEVLMEQGNYQEAHDLCAPFLNKLVQPKRVLWYEISVYERDLYSVISICSWYCGELVSGKLASNILLNKYPDNELYKKNATFYQEGAVS